MVAIFKILMSNRLLSVGHVNHVAIAHACMSKSSY